MNPGMMMNRPLLYQQPQMQNQPLQQQAKDAVPEEAKQQTNPMAQASSNMVEVLQNSTNPKHRNSEFLKFLNQLNQGAINIEGDKLSENPTKMAEWQASEAQRLDKEQVR